MNRRDALPLLGFAALAATRLAPASAEGKGTPVAFRVPRAEFLYECDVTLGETVPFGTVAEGTRRIIPITGGTFRGPTLSGTVVPGGADWNLTRNDGAGLVEASYYLRTDDGVMLRITNKGVGTPETHSQGEDEAFFMFTTPSFEAPAGKYAWMSKATFVGTLGARKNARNAVLIRVFQIL